MNKNKRLIILGVLLLGLSVPLHLVFGLFLLGYEDTTSLSTWDWPTGRQWVSSLSPGQQAGWWGSAIGSQLSLYGGMALVAFGLYRVFKSRQPGRA